MYTPIYRKLLTLPLHDTEERVFAIVQPRWRHGYITLREVPNMADERDWKFRVDRMVMRALTTERGFVVRGLIHTHPDPKQPDPSRRDYVNARKSYWMYAVYQPLLRRLVWYSNRNFTRVQYLKYTIRR